MPNRLIEESSPYLLQHAHNPVDWYPWGPEALEAAQRDEKPILLSVGYSACHWCHVMEHESFEDEQIAALMNKHFVCIKVDREERPDIDSIYMTAVQALTGQGGWPMTVFLTPDGKPYYGGTYFPPEDRGGLPSFPKVVLAMADAYRQRRGDVLATSAQVLQRIEAYTGGHRSVEPLTTDLLPQSYSLLYSQFDDQHGGIGLQPKFPQPMTHEFLLRYHLRTGDPDALKMVELTLEKMAAGGIYDQLGGGFHRYSTDRLWLVPHFEKMLYDNALLVKLYLHAYQLTGKSLYSRIVEETLDYVSREMTDTTGGFYTSQDADSEGVEGKFFVWRPEESISVLGEADGELLNNYYGVSLRGNFEGHSILTARLSPTEFARQEGIPEEEFVELLAASRAALLEVRERRVKPGRDDKVLTSWNGLMLNAFAEAGATLGRADYTAAAEQNAAFLLDHLEKEGRLQRTYKDGRANLNGYLEDYAFLASGLLTLHEATFESRWALKAIELGERMVDLFWDEPSQQFYDTGRDHEELVLRPREISDNPIPSGSSMAADVLLRLAVVTGESELEQRGVAAVRGARELMAGAPAGAGHWLCALDFYLSTTKEIAIVGDRGNPDTVALASQVFRRYLPNRVMLGRSNSDRSLVELPLLQGREAQDGGATAYVCQNYVCQLPVSDAGELAEQLSE